LTLLTAVAVARAPNKLAMTDREDAFKGLRPLAVRSRNFLKASGAPQGVVDDAEEFVRKLGGGRKSPKLLGLNQGNTRPECCNRRLGGISGSHDRSAHSPDYGARSRDRSVGFTQSGRWFGARKQVCRNLALVRKPGVSCAQRSEGQSGDGCAV
jgi:hypothetical protein